MTPEDQERQTDIIANGSPREIFEFARTVEAADIQALQNAMVNRAPEGSYRNFGTYAYGFAKHIEGADKKGLYHLAAGCGRHCEVLLHFLERDSTPDIEIIGDYLDEYGSAKQKVLAARFLQVKLFPHAFAVRESFV